jgi:predicted RNase H-like HicB family nuclease
MMITGRLWKDGSWWLAASGIADVCTQGRSRKAAGRMLADAFETLIDRSGCKVTVTDGGRGDDRSE